MTDITAPLTELRAAYRAYQAAKRDKKEEIREKYETRIAEEVRAAVEAEKYAFATRLRDLKEYYGLNVTDIQDHVLRTRNWKVWEDIRDYADIQPEQITREKSRAATKQKAEQSKKKYEWIDGALHWYKWSNGEQMPFPMIVSDYATLSGNINWGPTLFDVIDNDNALWKEIKATIQRDARSGIIPDRDLFRWQPGNEHLGEKQEELNAAWVGWTPDEG